MECLILHPRTADGTGVARVLRQAEHVLDPDRERRCLELVYLTASPEECSLLSVCWWQERKDPRTR